MKHQAEIHYQPESFSSSAYNGQKFILRAMTKTPCHDMFILYFNSLFSRVRCTKIQAKQYFCMGIRNAKLFEAAKSLFKS